jgi:uncharacterized protein YbjT (DUF2867 family)
MPTRIAMVAGATGLIGRHLLEQLLANPEHSAVIALVRRPLSMEHPKLWQKTLDFDALPSMALPRADDVYCALGTTIRTAGSQEAFRTVDYTYVVELASAAARSGASQFLVVSSLGADPTSRVFYSRVKGEMEEAVAKVGLGGVHIFRPSLLTGQRSESRAGERARIIAARALSFLMIGPLKKYRPIAAETVARGMIRTALANRAGVHVYESDVIAAM